MSDELMKKAVFEALDNCMENSPQTLKSDSINIAQELKEMTTGFEYIHLSPLINAINEYKLNLNKGDKQ